MFVTLLVPTRLLFAGKVAEGWHHFFSHRLADFKIEFLLETTYVWNGTVSMIVWYHIDSIEAGNKVAQGKREARDQ